MWIRASRQMGQWMGAGIVLLKSTEAGMLRMQSDYGEDVLRLSSKKQTWARSWGFCKPGKEVWSLFYQCSEAIREFWARKYRHLNFTSKISHWWMDVLKEIYLKRCSKNKSWAVAYFLPNLQFTENCPYHHLPPQPTCLHTKLWSHTAIWWPL